jgi:hypothetical protein
MIFLKVKLQVFKPTNTLYLGKSPLLPVINFPRTAASLVPLSGSLRQLQMKVCTDKILHISTDRLLHACAGIKDKLLKILRS